MLRWLDSRWRKAYWRWSRLYWRRPGEPRPPWPLRGSVISGHPAWLIALPIGLLVGVVMGPTLDMTQPWRLAAGLALAALAWGLFAVLERRHWSERFSFCAHLLTTACIFIIANRINAF